jgi:hypothetical protein
MVERHVEQEGLMAAERRRAGTGVDQDVVHGSVGAADKLALARAAAAVQPPQGAQPRPRLAVPEELADSAPAGHLDVERAGEESAVVVVRSGPQHEDARERCPFDLHDTILAASDGIRRSPARTEGL